MRVALRFVETHWNQAVPGVVVQLRARHAYRYLINTPAHTDRFLEEQRLAHNPNTVFLFSRSTTPLVSGLAPLVYSRIKDRPRAYPKILGDERLFGYLEELRYKLGFESANYSYGSWRGQGRKGISCSNTISALQNRVDASQIFDRLQTYIGEKVDRDKQHSVLDFYDPRTKVYEDGFVRIQTFMTGTEDRPTSHFVFSIKKDPSLTSLPLSQKYISEFNCSFAVLYHQSTASISDLIKNIDLMKRIGELGVASIVHLFEDHSISCSKQFAHFVKQLPQTAENIVFSHALRNNQNKITQIFARHKHLDLISQLQHKYPQYFPKIDTLMQTIQQQLQHKTKIVEQLFSRPLTVHQPNSEYIILPESERGQHLLPIYSNSSVVLTEDHSISQNRVAGRESVTKMLKECDPSVTFLGTASSYSNLYRSVSCILADIQETIFMFDCGEGAYGQFSTHFGTETASKLLETKVIFVTHCHSDHVLGIMEFISQRNKAMTDQNISNKLFLVIPANVIPWFHYYCQQIEDVSVGCQVIFVQGLLELGEGQQIVQQSVKINSCKTGRVKSASYHPGRQEVVVSHPLSLQIQFNRQQWTNVIQTYRIGQSALLQKFKTFLSQRRIKTFRPVPVLHCPQSYGVILQHTSGIKISYSGDTRPIASFAEAAKNSTLLIHQATFKDSQIKQAEERFHSTIGEAIEIGMKSRSWKTALTHFSEPSFRSGEMVDLEGDKNWKKEKYANEHTFLCCDHLQLRLSQMGHLPAITRKISREIIGQLKKKDN